MNNRQRLYMKKTAETEDVDSYLLSAQEALKAVTWQLVLNFTTSSLSRSLTGKPSVQYVQNCRHPFLCIFSAQLVKFDIFFP